MIAQLDAFELAILGMGILFPVILLSFYIRWEMLAGVFIMVLLLLGAGFLMFSNSGKFMDSRYEKLVFFGSVVALLGAGAFILPNCRREEVVSFSSMSTINSLLPANINMVLVCQKIDNKLIAKSQIGGEPKSLTIKRLLRKQENVPKKDIPISVFLGWLKDYSSDDYVTFSSSTCQYLLIDTDKQVVEVEVLNLRDFDYINRCRAGSRLASLGI